MRKIGVIYSDRYLDHDTGPHVENTDRLRAIKASLLDQEWADALEWVSPRAATVDEMATIHSHDYIRFVEGACKRVRGVGHLNPDTAVCSESYEVATLAVGGALEGIDGIMDGRLDGFFAPVRPPGHHAEYSDSLGFCLFNNVAIGALYAIEKYGLKRVFILDWDVHHGNGTQHSLEESTEVFYCSLHQYPHYPGTGARSEMGSGAGRGYTLNLPMDQGSEDADYAYLIDGVVAKAIGTFRPELLLISAGFDAHRSDPLSGIMLSTGCFGAMMQSLADSAGPDCRVGLLLEGGYNLSALASSVSNVLGVFSGAEEAEKIVGRPRPATLELGEYIIDKHPFFQNID